MECGEAQLAGAKKPYLRRGSGWESRVQAAREGRRYKPKGGPVLNYAEPAAAPPPRKSPSKPAPARQRAAVAKHAGSTSLAAASKRPASGSKLKAVVRPAALGAAAASLARHAPHPPQQQRQQKEEEQQQQQQQQCDWSKRLLASAASPQLSPQKQRAPSSTGLRGGITLPHSTAALHLAGAWGAPEGDADEEQELQEFCALESEVLREVSNTAQSSSGTAAVTRQAAQMMAPSLQKQPHSALTSQSMLEADQCSAASNLHQPQLQEAEDSDEDVFQSDGEGSTRHIFHPAQPRAAAKSVSFAESSVLCSVGGKAVVVEEEECELDAQSELIDEVPMKPTSSLVQKFFYSQKPEKAPAPQDGEKAREDLLLMQVEELEQQAKKVNDEQAKVAQRRRQVEDMRARLEQDKSAFEKRKAEELAQIEAMKMEELRKLQRDRRVLDQQSRALLKLPTKRDKEEIQALEAVLEKERQTARGKDARHKLTVDRLRRQILELQEKNRELQEEVKFLESQQLQQWGGKHSSLSPSKHNSTPPGSAPSQVQVKPARSSREHMATSRDGAAVWDNEELAGDKAAHTAGLAAGMPVQQPAQQRQDSMDASASDFLDDGHVVAEELGEEILEDALPAVRVTVLKPAVQPAAAPLHSLQQQAAQRQQPPAEPCAAASHQAAQVPDVMAQASSALHRFNQLKESLSGRLGSLHATPVAPAAALAPADEAYERVAQPAVSSSHANSVAGSGAHDDLRRLGRMLTFGNSAPAVQPVPSAMVATGTTEFAAHQQQGLEAQQHMAQGTAGGGGSALAQLHANTLDSIPATAAAPQPGSAEDAVTSERQCSDGRVECVYASGLRVSTFPNGSQKQQWPDGHTATLFGNGDIKQASPDGRVEYYYAAVGCWHVTHPHNIEVFFFPSGQVEAHHPGGIKEIMFPDGSLRKVLPDGRELAITSHHLSKEIQLPQPQPATSFVR